MEELGDGRVYARKGEIFPFVCPYCERTQPFDNSVTWLHCICGYEGSDQDFKKARFKLESQVQ